MTQQNGSRQAPTLMTVLLGVTMVAVPVGAAPFTNGGFEVPVVTQQRQHVPIPGWDISQAPTCQLYLLGYIGLRAIEGNQLLAISHEDGALGEAVSQTFDTTVGTRYEVRFSAAWTGNPSSRDLQVLTTVKSSTGEVLASTNVHLPAKEVWGTTVFSFAAKTPSATLSFKDNSSIAFQTAIFLDDVRVLAAVPREPCKTMVGGIVANQIWTQAESPYCVTNDVYVSGLLRIREGVEVRLEGNHVFEVGGRIRADGTTEAPIQFHPADATVGWQGLLFRDAVAGSYFVHTIIEGSKNSGVRLTNTPPAFTNCVIRSNTSPSHGGGINAEVTSGDLALSSCHVAGNQSTHGGGISAVMNSGTLVLNGCVVTNNQSSLYGGGVYLIGQGNFTDCVISRNRTTGSDATGGGVSAADKLLTLRNCEVAENTASGSGAIAGGVYVSGYSSFSQVELLDCRILKNQATRAGGGLFLYRNARATAVNCLFTANQPEAIQVWNSAGWLRLTNSIVFFNTDGATIGGDGASASTVAYSDIQGRVWPGPGNISVSPALCPDNYSLIEGSPCIDAGHPGLEFRDGCRSDEPCSPFARGGPRNDMGAYGGPGVCYWTQPREEPVIRIAPDNTIGVVGQPVSLGVIATGAEPLTYQWFKNGAPLAGQSNAVLTIVNSALASVGEYYVQVTNPLGEVNSPFLPDLRPVRLGIAQLEARTAGLSSGRPRLLIRNGQAGAKCAIYSVSQFGLGDTVTVPGTPPAGWELRDTLTFTASEVGWTDPRVLGAGEARYYGVLPAP